MNFRFKFLQQKIILHRRNEVSHGREMEAVHWNKLKKEFPYKSLNDPEYIKEREDFFSGHNGWWWGDGVWNGKHETPMQRQRRYRDQKNA